MLLYIYDWFVAMYTVQTHMPQRTPSLIVAWHVCAATDRSQGSRPRGPPSDMLFTLRTITCIRASGVRTHAVRSLHQRYICLIHNWHGQHAGSLDRTAHSPCLQNVSHTKHWTQTPERRPYAASSPPARVRQGRQLANQQQPPGASAHRDARLSRRSS